MMGGVRVFDNLNLREKTAIMAVLSRDRQLRETEEERVMKLRIDLAKERRDGALVAGKDTSQKKRSCARCRGQVGILQSSRCPACKHVVCKKCRVVRVQESVGDVTRNQTETHRENVAELAEITRTVSNSSYPAELNPFETGYVDDLSSNTIPTGCRQHDQKSAHFTLDVPSIECEVIEDDDDVIVESNVMPVTSTPYDPFLGRSLVGGEISSMALPGSLNIESDDCVQEPSLRRFSDISHMRKKRQSYQKSKVSNRMPNWPREHDKDSTVRRKLYDNIAPSSDKSMDIGELHSAHTNSPLLISPYLRSPSAGLADCDDRHVLSDSSAYVTAPGPASDAVSSSFLREDQGFPGLTKKSNSTGYLPEFDEKEAVEFLMQIGSKYSKPAEFSPETDESVDDLPQAEIELPKEDELPNTLEEIDKKTGDVSISSQNAKETQSKAKRKNPMSILSSAWDVVVKDFRNDNILSKPPIDPKKKLSFGSFLSKPLSFISPKAPVQRQKKKDDNSATKLFEMATNTLPTRPHPSTPIRSLLKPPPADDVTHFSESAKNDSDRISMLSHTGSERDLAVDSRQSRSNPNSPFLNRKEMLSEKADDVACISEVSAPPSEDEYFRKESSSSDAPSTSSSDEYQHYYYIRRKGRGFRETHPLTPNFAIKDSGYSTHENYLQAKTRSKYMRATRLSRRARERERGLRRLGRKSLRERSLREVGSSRSETSSDLGDFVGRKTAAADSAEAGNPFEVPSANTNIRGGSTGSYGDDINAPAREVTIQPDSGDRTNPTTQPMRKSSSARIIFQRLASRMRSKSIDDAWVCRVCDKALEVRKKSGDWFYKNARPEVLEFKELLVNTKRRLSGDAPLALRMTERFQAKVSPLTFESNEESSLLFESRRSRLRSNTLPCDLNLTQRAIPGLHKSPSTASMAEHSVEMSQLEANMQRQRIRIGRKSVAEVLHGTLLLDVPDPRQPGAPPPFLKKQSSGVEKIVVPASIQDGPDDVTILRGNPISLCCALSGTPPLKSVWRKGKKEITTSNKCCLDSTDTSAALTIRKSERDDSGCYILQVKNSGGVDQYSINVSVVDVPDPPGQPYASDIAGSTLVVSWYGAGYDGGSTITGYRVEMANVTVSSRSPKWSQVATAKSTTCTVKDLKLNSKYVFRVCAENRHGVGAPGQQSDVVSNTVTKVEESSEDEETFVKRDAVTIKTDGSFSQRYETKERLGQGRFGKVHRVVDRETGKEYAAKIMRALKAKDREIVQQEIDIMNSLRHPCLVQLVDAYSHGREITMVMDLVSGGELFERVIDEDFELTEAACIKYMSQICDGLKYMHDTLILHLDLKPENIMCMNKTGTQIKIIDFGLARRYNPRETIRVMFGTPEFVAPEVINYDAIGPQTDMWSVGVICYILLSGLSPFMGDNDAETLSNITAVEWDFDDEAFDEISHDAKDFIRQLLVKNLNKRYTVHKALEHKWLKKDTNKMAKSKLNTKNLKRFLARRKWQKTGNAVRALGRLASLANLGSSNSNPKKISNGQPRESGFLAALKAQLLRENEEDQDGPSNCKPMFETLFDDVEVIEGSAAKFECTITGTPDPEIMWFKDGEPIKESRHFRISFTEDDVCTLLVTDATEADEAEYTCKAVNCEGETEHRAELIVITPGV